MSSKIKSFLPWEYLSELKKDFVSIPGLYGFSCSDPYVSKIISQYLTSGSSFQVKSADEITREWFEDTIGGYDLFASEQSFKIMNGDDLKNISFFTEEHREWGDNKILVLFKNDKKNFKSLAGVWPENFFKVTTPKPWQANRLIDFYLKSMNLTLDRTIIEFLSEALPYESALYMNAIKTIFLHARPGMKLDLNFVKNLISSQKLDYFQLADTWMSGNKKLFFKNLIPLHSFDEMMKLSMFMQSHLIKLIDPSYLDEKSNPNQYDRKILKNSKETARAEWEKDLRLFAEIEILAKQKSPQIESFIKSRSI